MALQHCSDGFPAARCSWPPKSNIEMDASDRAHDRGGAPDRSFLDRPASAVPLRKARRTTPSAEVPAAVASPDIVSDRPGSMVVSAQISYLPGT